MKTHLFIISSLALAGITSAATESTHMAGRENKEPGPPGYTMVQDNDRAMEHAVKRARNTLGFFVAAMHAKKPADSGFEVKKAFIDGGNVEHLWVGELSFDGKNFRGKINNRPRDLRNVRLGQQVVVAPHEISDWMFVKNGELIGGYTTRVLYARLSAKDKAEFNKKADFKIEPTKH